mmetsp:Transcript_51364/g.92556  ORF Transcript_51364/g.92556 Transcript_51364/m.92556 type:complete len:86 (+) Transcript_51364:212-469(+)
MTGAGSQKLPLLGAAVPINLCKEQAELMTTKGSLNHVHGNNKGTQVGVASALESGESSLRDVLHSALSKNTEIGRGLAKLSRIWS